MWVQGRYGLEEEEEGGGVRRQGVRRLESKTSGKM